MQNFNSDEKNLIKFSKPPVVTVITPNYNTEIEIIEYLNSLKRQDYPLECIEIIIIDNGSKDKSLQNVNTWFVQNRLFYKTKLIELKKNLGIAQAYNEGYNKKSSESEIIVRTESDVELENNCLSTLVNTLMSDNNYGIVGSRGILFYDKKTINHAARYLNWWNGVVTEFDPPTLTECDFVFGGTFAIKSEIIREMTYFFKKDRFLASELELCTRVRRKGYKILCQPEAISYHKGGYTTNKLVNKKFQFVNSRESTLFHMEFNPFPSKLVLLFNAMISNVYKLIRFNKYPLCGFLSGLFSYIFNRDVYLPYDPIKKTISEWLTE
jgi:GT2 family glycosyltransferase